MPRPFSAQKPWSRPQSHRVQSIHAEALEGRKLGGYHAGGPSESGRGACGSRRNVGLQALDAEGPLFVLAPPELSQIFPLIVGKALQNRVAAENRRDGRYHERPRISCIGRSEHAVLRATALQQPRSSRSRETPTFPCIYCANQLMNGFMRRLYSIWQFTLRPRNSSKSGISLGEILRRLDKAGLR